MEIKNEIGKFWKVQKILESVENIGIFWKMEKKLFN